LLIVYLVSGGALGTLARYGLGNWIHGWAGIGFPWGTLTVNVAGSFALGFLVRAADTLAFSPDTRAFLTVGFCGAFTTFSTLSYESVVLMQAGDWGRALGYLGASITLGIAALVLGLNLAGAVVGAR
jgi:CrcB protein